MPLYKWTGDIASTSVLVDTVGPSLWARLLIVPGYLVSSAPKWFILSLRPSGHQDLECIPRIHRALWPMSLLTTWANGIDDDALFCFPVCLLSIKLLLE